MNLTDPHTLRVLEWDQLCAELSTFASTHWGRQALVQLSPDPSGYRGAFELLRTCVDLLRTQRILPLTEVPDVEPILRRAAAEGARLEAEDHLAASRFFELIQDLRRFGEEITVDALGDVGALLSQLETAPGYTTAVSRCIEADGSISDRASARLKSLRRELRQVEGTILERLQKVAGELGGDSVVTLREGRHVVSVPDRDRSRVPGVVHDRSQSGTTFFIEPLTTLEQGNRLRNLEADIRQEIQQILRDLTDRLRQGLTAAREAIPIVTRLDSLWARARWAHRLGAEIPRLTDEPELDLRQARHPLLVSQRLQRTPSLAKAREEVVPFDLSFDTGRRGLIISGPNTGGKTVCLKTLGLVVVMTQAGVPPLADPGSSVGSLDAVFADIGDEQSLALSLSTFSAHLKRVGDACRRATGRSLVLLDELGVGTDPEEGTSLARAVIHHLVHLGAIVVVTTHYNALKLLPEEDPRIENGAFLFSDEKLAPTYELAVGRPGQSYALQLARQMSFPDRLLDMAESGVGDETRKMSALIARLADRESELARMKESQQEQASRLNALVRFNEDTRRRMERLNRTAEADARRQADEIVDRTRRETERLVAEIRRSQAEPQVVKRVHRALSELVPPDAPEEDGPKPARNWRPGMRVLIEGIREPGEIVQVYRDGDRVSVRIGNMMHTVSSRRLAAIDSPREEASPNDVRRPIPPTGPLSTDSSLPYEIDLRGRTVEEAKLELEDLLAPLAAQGVRSVRVIHGHGTGALRRALTPWFRAHALVTSSRRGRPGEGGDGVTVIELKS